MRKFKIGVIQIDSQDNVEKNLEKISSFAEEAAEENCKMVVLPENANYTGNNAPEVAEDIPGGITFKFISDLAKKHKIWIYMGSIYEKSEDYKKPYNATFIVDSYGELRAKYHKLHPFDISVKDGPNVTESDRIKPGDDIVVLDSGELGVFGLSICYDMRFPELYRVMALEGANIIFVPADFTMNTGKDHWEPLLRARAIENGCYVVAPGQIGIKPRFQAYGKSMVIDPWGNIVAKASDIECLITANIDLDYVDKIRAQIGTLTNRRADKYSITRI